MGIVIDTNFFIDIENQRLDLDKLNDFSAYGGAYMASITVSELLLGVHLAKDVALRIKRNSFVEGIIASFSVLHFDEKVARTYAEIFAYFIKPRSKASSSIHDLQIAATALAHGFPVLTSNVQDFKQVPGLKILHL